MKCNITCYKWQQSGTEQVVFRDR